MCVGGGGGGTNYIYLTLNCHHQISAFRWAAMRAILMSHLSLTVRVDNATPVH